MTQIPSKEQILEWVAAHPEANSKRDIAKAFGIKGAARIDLKRLLKELEAAGQLERRRRHYLDAEKLPPVTVLELLAPDGSGDLFARPMEWRNEGPMPRILYVPRESDPALGRGDRFLGRLAPVVGEEYQYEARLIRRVTASPNRITGIFRKDTEGGRIMPIDKGQDREWRVRSDATLGAENGELVQGEQVGPKNRMGVPWARIIDRLGDPSAPRAVSLIAIHQHGIPDEFPDAVISEAESAKPATMKGRDDLRDLPLVTIDPSDARDHDDAVAAQVEEDRRRDHLGRHRRCRPLRPHRQRAGPRGVEPRQFQLFPRPRGADAARGAVGGSVFAARGRRPPRHRRPDAAGRAGQQGQPYLPPRHDEQPRQPVL